jgi:hypothetical protein
MCGRCQRVSDDTRAEGGLTRENLERWKMSERPHIDGSVVLQRMFFP